MRTSYRSIGELLACSIVRVNLRALDNVGKESVIRPVVFDASMEVEKGSLYRGMVTRGDSSFFDFVKLVQEKFVEIDTQ